MAVSLEGSRRHRQLREGGGAGDVPTQSVPLAVVAESSSFGLNLATEGQLKHWVGIDSQGSFPSGLKLFAQLGSGAGRALSLCASLATPRVPWTLRGGTSAARRPGPPPARDHHSAARSTVAAARGSATCRCWG